MKYSLRTKTVILIIMIAVVIGITGIAVSSRFISQLIDRTYEDKANDIAHTMAAIIDAERVKKLRDEVLTIFDNTGAFPWHAG